MECSRKRSKDHLWCIINYYCYTTFFYCIPAYLPLAMIIIVNGGLYLCVWSVNRLVQRNGIGTDAILVIAFWCLGSGNKV